MNDDEYEVVYPEGAEDAKEHEADAPESEDHDDFRFDDWALI